MLIAHESKPGWKTTEFWILILVNLAPELGAVDVGNTKVKGLLHLVTAAAYMIGRGLAKQGVPAEEVPVLDDVPEADQGDAGLKGATP